MVLGDWGDTALPGQQQVAYAMASWAAANNPQFIISTGDNFYPSGVRSTTDPQWTNKWVNVYNNDTLVDLPWYISVGNHDYGNDKGMTNVFFNYTLADIQLILEQVNSSSFHHLVLRIEVLDLELYA